MLDELMICRHIVDESETSTRVLFALKKFNGVFSNLSLSLRIILKLSFVIIYKSRNLKNKSSNIRSGFSF